MSPFIVSPASLIRGGGTTNSASHFQIPAVVLAHTSSATPPPPSYSVTSLLLSIYTKERWNCPGEASCAQSSMRKEMGADYIILAHHDNQYTLKNSVIGELVIKHAIKDLKSVQSNFCDLATNAESEIHKKMLQLECFANYYLGFGLLTCKKDLRLPIGRIWKNKRNPILSVGPSNFDELSD